LHVVITSQFFDTVGWVTERATSL